MPELGTIRRIGNSWNYQVYVACERCGRERWVNKYSPAKLCRHCVRRLEIDIDMAKKLYYQDKLTFGQVGQQLGMSGSLIADRFTELGLPHRTKSENGRLLAQKGLIPQLTSKGINHCNWKGGRHKTTEGYALIYMPDYPRANKDGYVLEHIWVWEQTHNKPLPDGWIIHHINGIKDDNRPSNLKAMPRNKHHFNLLSQTRAKRIRELEVENKLLRKSLEDNQSIFVIEELPYKFPHLFRDN